MRTEEAEEEEGFRPSGATGNEQGNPLILPFQAAFPGLSPDRGGRNFFGEWRAIANDDDEIVSVLRVAQGVARSPGWVTTVLASVRKLGSFEAWRRSYTSRSGPPVRAPDAAAPPSPRPIVYLDTPDWLKEQIADENGVSRAG